MNWLSSRQLFFLPLCNAGFEGFGKGTSCPAAALWGTSMSKVILPDGNADWKMAWLEAIIHLDQQNWGSDSLWTHTENKTAQQKPRWLTCPPSNVLWTVMVCGIRSTRSCISWKWPVFRGVRGADSKMSETYSFNHLLSVWKRGHSG